MIRLGLAFLLATTTAVPAFAQSRAQSPEQRIERIEKELRAVQRKVFPGGDAAFFEPEIQPQRPTTPAGQPADTPVAELTARIDGLEREVARMTGQLEQAEHRLNLISQQAAKDRADFDARLKALEPQAPVVAAPLPAPAADAAMPPRPSPAGRPAATPARPAPTAAAPAPVAAEDRATSADAAKDPAEAAYLAGYNLWMAKKYTEAQASLRQFVAKYPKHRRASYAQNLLGRAYLDAGQPANAAQAFATNYQTNPRGERAPDSLYYLGTALTRLNKQADACKVYAEFDAAYGTTASASLKDRVAAGRKAAKCS